MDTSTDPYLTRAMSRATNRRREQAAALRRLADLLVTGTIPEINSGMSVWLDTPETATNMGTTIPELTAQVMGALAVDLSAGPKYETVHTGYPVAAYDAGLSADLDITVWVRTTSPEPPDANPAEVRDELDRADGDDMYGDGGADDTCPGGC